MKLPAAVVIVVGLSLMGSVFAESLSPDMKYGPSAHARSILLRGDRERFPYPGTATDNAVLAGYDDVVVRLLRDPAIRKTEGPGALLAAIQTPNPHIVGLILAAGISPNDVDGGGAGALTYAIVTGDNGILCLLADYGVDLTAGELPHLPMLAALASGNLDAAQFLSFIGYKPGQVERGKLQDLGKKRGQWKLWDALLAITANEEQAARICRRVHAVPSPPTRIR